MDHFPLEPTTEGMQAPPPYDFPEIKLFGFPLVAELDALQDVCDRYLGIAPASTGITFELIHATALQQRVGIVMLQAVDYPSMTATKEPCSDFGGFPQQ